MESLQNCQAILTSILQISEDAVLSIDMEQNIILYNVGAEKIFGYTPDEVIGKPLDILLPKKFRELHKNHIQQFAASKDTSHEMRSLSSGFAYRKNGEEFPIEAAISKLEKNHETIFTVILRDITKRRQAETLQLELERQLQQAQKMEAVGQLTGGIAHDFNNMLASILGYTELLRDRLVDSADVKTKEYLEEVLRAGERARELVVQLLAFSRGSGNGGTQMLVLPLLVQEVIQMLNATLPSSIDLVSQFDEGVPAVRMDPLQLHQIITNLCINARDTMSGRGQLKIKLQQRVITKTECTSCHEVVDGSYVELSVSDTGAGMDPKILEHIFEPFYTTKEIGKGTGMGLSMVHGLMHKHDGHIFVDTTLGAGTNFQLLFPVVADPEPAIQSFKSTAIKSGTFDSAHIMIVDDEVSVAGFLQELLKNQGYRVTVETNSQEALARFVSSPETYDLLLTDQTMPEITGVELAEQFLRLKPDLPVILCTGYSESVDEQKIKIHGIDTYLSKPIDTELLLKHINSLLSNYSSTVGQEHPAVALLDDD